MRQRVVIRTLDSDTLTHSPVHAPTHAHAPIAPIAAQSPPPESSPIGSDHGSDGQQGIVFETGGSTQGGQ